MKPTIEDAVIALIEAQNNVRRLGRAIGEAMQASYETQTSNGGTYTDWLEAAYKREHENNGYTDAVYYVNHDDDVEGYLAEHCSHALRAHNLIQERKAARKQLGICRRRISVMGAALLRAREE